jgi:hypothetical protein
MVAHGAPGLATDVLRGAVRTAPVDPDLLAHLADVEASTGQFLAARNDLRRAVALAPHRADLSDRLHAVERVLAIDPTLPNLTLVARTRRARTLLRAVVDQSSRCAPVDTADADLRSAATRRLRARARTDAEAAEEELSLAVRLWAASPACHGPDVESQALAQVLYRVGLHPGLTP